MDKKYVAKVKMTLNKGHLKVQPGTVIELGDEDRAQGVNIENLLKNGGIEPYVDDARADEIKDHWETTGRSEREGMRAANIRESRQRRKRNG